MPANGWFRYRTRNLENAWHAIDDIRELLVSPADFRDWRQRIRINEQAIDELQDSEQVAKAVTDAIRRERALGLTLLQKVLAGGIALVFAAGAVASLIEVLK